LFASFGRASKVPSFYALGSPRALGGNPDLRPESALGGEVGADRTFDSAHLTLGVSAFGQWYEDLIDFDFDTFQLVNRSSVRTSGIESRVAWQPHARLVLSGELTWLRAEDSEGAILLQQPELFGGFRLTFTPVEKVSLRLFARTVSRYEDRQIPVPELETVAGHTVAGLAGSWRFHDGLSLRVRADNVFDSDYETYLGFPGPRRSAWVGIGWERP
jgi:outer membrane cobalamin receptor